MAEIINLNRARKRRDRSAKSAQAAANRAKFGRNKTEQAADAQDRARADRTLDDARRD